MLPLLWVHSGLWVKCVLVRTRSSLRMSYEQKQSASLQSVAEVTSSEFKYTHPANNVGHSFFQDMPLLKELKTITEVDTEFVEIRKLHSQWVLTAWPLTACFLIYKMEVPLCIH